MKNRNNLVMEFWNEQKSVKYEYCLASNNDCCLLILKLK